ncbi:MAG: hypothetical protein HY535_02790 [Chloroflexi bacterium]|nr:hypothetical protein [Chloroflexota bacterium]
MAYNFMQQDRDQGYLLPPTVREWLPQGDLACFLDVVAQMDLKRYTGVTGRMATGIPPSSPPSFG